MRTILKFAAALAAIPILYLAWIGADVWQTSKQDSRPKSDAIVVMGAAQYNGRPSRVFKARLDHAKDLFDRHVAPLIVILGGKKEGDRFTEAQAGAAYLEQYLPAAKVTGVKAGATTFESLQLFTGMAKDRHIQTIVIVSDPLHLARARSIARDLGFEAHGSPAKIHLSKEGYGANLLRETLLLAHYRIFKPS